MLLVTTAPTAQEEELEQINSAIKRGEAKKSALESQAKSVAKEREKLVARMVDFTRDIRLTEANILRLDIRIDTLDKAASEKRTNLLSRKEDMVELIAALQRMGMRPPALTLLQPQEALTTARSAALLSTLLPHISKGAKRLRGDIKGLSNLYTELSTQRFSLKDSLMKLAAQNDKLKVLIAQRERQESRARLAAKREAERLQTLFSRSHSMQDILKKLDAERKRAAEREAKRLAEAAARRSRSTDTASAPTQPSLMGRPDGSRTSFSSARGKLSLPVIGSIISKFGDKNGPSKNKGIEVRSRSASQVIAPFDGQIVYAGPFRDYGQLLIISHGNGFHSLVAGFGTLYSALGQWVLQGEPIGAMSNTGSSRPNLYVEIRRNGKSINPEPWFTH